MWIRATSGVPAMARILPGWEWGLAGSATQVEAVSITDRSVQAPGQTACDEDVFNACRRLTRLFECGFVGHHLWIEDGDVGGKPRLEQPPIAQPEGGGGKSGHLVHGLFQLQQL